MPKQNRGFSLIELVIIVTIIAIITGIVISILRPRTFTTRSRDAISKNTLSKLAESIETYRHLEGRVPSGDTNNNGNYLEASENPELEKYLKAWPSGTPKGSNYVLRSDGTNFAIKVDKQSEDGCYIYCSNTGAVIEKDVVCPDISPDCNITAAAPPSSYCGDLTCDAGETNATCPSDCPATPPPSSYCGDLTCDAGETSANCPSDCPVAPPTPYCGDLTCDAGETNATCPSDCPVIPPTPSPGLLATYFDNQELWGLSEQKIDANIDFPVTWNNPTTHIDSDTYSVRWEGFVTPTKTETYTFYAYGTDGVRLWVNNQQLINKWKNNGSGIPPYGPVEEWSGSVALTAGVPVPFRMEYYQWCSAGQEHLSWSSPTTPKQIVPASAFTHTGSPAAFVPPVLVLPTYTTGLGFKGEYFNNTTLSGSPLFTRRDATLDFKWGCGENPTDRPHPSLWSDNFSVRWTSYIQAPYTGTITFHTVSDEGVRLWVNNVRIINEFHNSDSVEYTGSIDLVQGNWYPIRVEYFEWVSEAEMHLYWSWPGQARTLVPNSRVSTP